MSNSNIPSQIVQKAPIVVGGTPAPAPAPSTIVQAQTSTNSSLPMTLTRYQFRSLFTTAERIAIDNAQYNTKLSGTQKAAINTMQIDMNVSENVVLNSPAVIQGVDFLVTCQLITTARAVQILSNHQPA
jgi:hypothetical protein